MAPSTSGSGAGAASSSGTDMPQAGAEASSDAQLAQAFRDLARGEQTAQALEANLTSLERKLDDLLASLDKAEEQKVEDSEVAKGSDVSGKS